MIIELCVAAMPHFFKPRLELLTQTETVVVGEELDAARRHFDGIVSKMTGKPQNAAAVEKINRVL